MGQRMTWEEMKRNYPNEWLLITDYETNECGRVITGVVERHSTDKDEVYRLPAIDKNCAFKYTGESTFRGWRSHAEHSGL